MKESRFAWTDGDVTIQRDESPLAKDQPSAFQVESARIAENKLTWEGKPHKFVGAAWTHPNGHPRCLRCGREESMGGVCGNEKRDEKVVEAFDKIPHDSGRSWDRALDEARRSVPNSGTTKSLYDKGINGGVTPAMIEKRVVRRGNKWLVTTEDGSKLGEHDTKEQAIAQLGAVESNKEPKQDDKAKSVPALEGDKEDAEDYKAPKVKAAEVLAEKAAGSEVQTLIFEKGKYPKAEEAKAWANDHGFKAEKVDETGESFRLRQTEPGKYARMKTIDLTTGVQAVVGWTAKSIDALREAFAKFTHVTKIVVKADAVECEPVEQTDLGTIFRVSWGDGRSARAFFAEKDGQAVPLPHYMPLAKGGYVTVSKAEELKYTLGVCYPAKEVDFHGDTMTAVELEKAAWGYMSKDGGAKVGLMHRPGTAGAGRVVESYIYRGPKWTSKSADGSGEEQTVDPGDWMLGVVWNDEAWNAIKAGGISGYSLQGVARKEAF